MFDIAPTEFLLVVVVALLVIGPKDLPKAMRFVGKWMGKARGMARHFRAGMDTMMREAELEELEKQWKTQNAEIMRQFPSVDEMGTTAATKPASRTGNEQHNDVPSVGTEKHSEKSVNAAQKDFEAASAGKTVSHEPQENPNIGVDAPVNWENHKVPPPSSELP